jgi:hypothetical protein
MAFGRPFISDPKGTDLRNLIAPISAARQRIEILEAAITALQALPNSSSAQIAQLQAQISSLVASSATLGLKAANTVLAGPTSGGQAVPTFRALQWADLPLLSALSTTSALDEDDLVLLERAGTRLQATLADLRAYLDTEFWNEVAGDYTVDSVDAGGLIATTGMSGAQTIFVPGEDVPYNAGDTTRIAQEGEATVDIVPVSGVQLLTRVGTTLAGQYAVAWLTKRAPDVWYLYGDLV